MSETVENRFNLVEEPWIPVADAGLVSLRDIFTKPALRSLGGNPLQKIAITKLLLAIVQAAWTPDDDDEWESSGCVGMAQRALQYLEGKKDLFWLFGEKPFLQQKKLKTIVEDRTTKELNMAKKDSEKQKIITNALPKIVGNGDFPDLPSENNTMLFQNDYQTGMDDAGKAIFLVTLLPFAFAGKQVDNSIVFDNSNPPKSSIAKVGPSLGRICYLHTYIMSDTILFTLYHNLWSKHSIQKLRYLEEGVGTPPWEIMPSHENCPIAINLRKSFIGMLVPLSRFVLFENDRLYYTEGIQYPNHKDGWLEPSMATKQNGRMLSVLQAKTNRKPWRELNALLAFVAECEGYSCLQLNMSLLRARQANVASIKIWSAGLEVTGDAFGQKVRGTNDFVESIVNLTNEYLGKSWFDVFNNEMIALDQISKILSKSVYNYHKREIKDSKERDKRAATQSEQSQELFWQLCERKYQELVDACYTDTANALRTIRLTFVAYINKAYNTYCPADTARQLDAWAANRPNLKKYFT
jgi:CRISPR system Cascade subunit CasA